MCKHYDHDIILDQEWLQRQLTLFPTYCHNWSTIDELFWNKVNNRGELPVEDQKAKYFPNT